MKGINARSWFYGQSFHSNAEIPEMPKNCEHGIPLTDTCLDCRLIVEERLKELETICHHRERQADGSCETCDELATERAYKEHGQKQAYWFDSASRVLVLHPVMLCSHGFKLCDFTHECEPARLEAHDYWLAKNAEGFYVND